MEGVDVMSWSCRMISRSLLIVCWCPTGIHEAVILGSHGVVGEVVIVAVDVKRKVGRKI